MRRRLEVCLTDFRSAEAAAAGGADRVELCADLASGGITPSAGMIAQVASKAGIATHVLIRPRPGDFVYDLNEMAIMLDDIDYVKSAGAAGVVIGASRADGRIDVESTARLINRARPLQVTFHKAIDLAPSPLEALDDLISLGIDRVLTSGGPGLCRDNLTSLRRMVEHAAGRITIMAGGGIREDDLPRLIDECGIAEFHLGSGVTGPTPLAGAFGSVPPVVEAVKVRKVAELLR